MFSLILEGSSVFKQYMWKNNITQCSPHTRIIFPRPPSPAREVQRYRKKRTTFRMKYEWISHVAEVNFIFFVWQRLDVFFYLWRQEMRSGGVKPIASLLKIRTPNNCGNIDDKARRGNCSERVWLKAHVREAEAIKGLVYFKSKEDMLRAW